MHSVVRRALDTYDSLADAQVGELQDLVRIPCPPGEEGAAQSWLAGRMIDLGLDVERVECDPARLARHRGWSETGEDYAGRPNLAGVWRGSGGGRSLILHAHADVASIEPRELWTADPWSGTVADRRLYGRGAWDDKSGCVALIQVARTLQKAGVRLRGDLTLETTIDEERACNGALALVESGHVADGVVAVDGGGFGRPLVAFPGMVSFQVAVYGRQTAYNQPSGVSAIENAGAVIEQLKQLEKTLNSEVGLGWNEVEAPIDIVVTRIDGGEWNSVLPGRCLLHGFATYVPPLTERRLRSRLRHAIDVADGDEGRRVRRAELVFGGLGFPPFDAGRSNAMVEAVAKTFREIRGERIEPRAARAFSDIFQQTADGRIPACMVSPGLGGNPHAADEYYDLDSMRPAMHILIGLVLEWCGFDDVDGRVDGGAHESPN